MFREFADAPEMVVIPAGSFVMGSPPDEAQRRDDEDPTRVVTFARPFALGRYPVTFLEWDAAVGRDGSLHKPDDAGWGRGLRPVIDVSWRDAWDFASEMNTHVAGSPYRLPSESEWEYACRAGTQTPFWTGKTISTVEANFDGHFTYGPGRKGRHRRKTAPVGTFRRTNPFGLFDMHGNVWEWVEDAYVEAYSGAPVDGSRRRVPGDSQRVLRGGSWDLNPWVLRSAGRGRSRTDYRIVDVGFRLARTLAP